MNRCFGDYQARLHRDFLAQAERYNPQAMFDSLVRQGYTVAMTVSESEDPRPLLWFADKLKMQQLRRVMPELDRVFQVLTD
jgi:hypothetical protein